MMSAALVDASLNLLKSTLELAMDTDKRSLGTGIDLLAKLATLLGQADKDLAAATEQQRLLVRRGMAITALMVKSVCAVAPPETNAATWAQGLAKGFTRLVSGAQALLHNAEYSSAPKDEPGDRLLRQLNAVASMVASNTPTLDTPNHASPKLLLDWLGPPLNTPWATALWEELTAHQTGEEAPWLATSQERRWAERHFMSEWRAYCSNGTGAELEREVQSAIQGDGERLWDYLTQSYSGWGERHIYGNLKAFEESDTAPFIPLRDMYVEPLVQQIRSESAAHGHAIPLIRQSIEKYRMTILTGAMGYGKTLTARAIVEELARNVLNAHDTIGERWQPVYVLCREHLKPGASLSSLVSEAIRAEWAEMSGEWLEQQDERLRRPRDRKIVVVLDGFDEVVMGEKDRDNLVSSLYAETSARQHIFLVTRPGVLPKTPPKECAHFEMCRFDVIRQNAWLQKFGQFVQTGPASVKEVPAEYRELMGEPILLFMVASVWPEIKEGQTQSGSRAMLFERFMRRTARGKLRLEAGETPSSSIVEVNPQIDDGADIILNRLIEDWKTTRPGETPEREDAMLWILGRIALKMHREGQGTTEPHLSVTDALGVVMDVMGSLDKGLDMQHISSIKLACVLTTHLKYHGRDQVMYFGHRSFFEFLVARAWREQLRHIVCAKGESKRAREEKVLEDMLIQAPEDRTIDFLIDLLQLDSETMKDDLIDWAYRMVHDLRVGAAMEDGVEKFSVDADTRAPLSLAAFAIGGTLARTDGFSVRTPATLRRVIAWAWLTGRDVWVIAPNLRLVQGVTGWGLQGAQLSGSYFRFADFSESDFFGANLVDADLSGAKLCRVNLSGANLNGALLMDADMTESAAVEASFRSSQMVRVKMARSLLRRTNFSFAKLNHADLSGADLREACFRSANLGNVNFAGATIDDVDFSFAKFATFGSPVSDLSGVIGVEVNFAHASLSIANLNQAQLPGARLYATNLYSVRNLATANLRNAQFTRGHPHFSDTTWPRGFDPIAAGALPNLPGQDAWPPPHPNPNPTKKPPPPTEDDDPA